MSVIAIAIIDPIKFKCGNILKKKIFLIFIIWICKKMKREKIMEGKKSNDDDFTVKQV